MLIERVTSLLKQIATTSTDLAVEDFSIKDGSQMRIQFTLGDKTVVPLAIIIMAGQKCYIYVLPGLDQKIFELLAQYGICFIEEIRSVTSFLTCSIPII